MESFGKTGRKVIAIAEYKWILFIKADGEALRITICKSIFVYGVLCVLCVSTCASVYYLISV